MLSVKHRFRQDHAVLTCVPLFLCGKGSADAFPRQLGSHVFQLFSPAPANLLLFNPMGIRSNDVVAAYMVFDD